ncbi:P-loop containing nucleoside triphosphate hydrolase protein [Suillus lakei]|nr:P-loop containing nucleoside triphosphate hydrolase protein [Suillus lakei]
MSRPAGRRSSISSISFPSPADFNYTGPGVGEPLHRTDTCNVVLLGDSGAGKSSLVNLIAGTNIAMISSDVMGCTTRTDAHEILIQNNQNETLKVKLFDTPGLNEGSRGTVPDKEARRILKNLIGTLLKQGGIHLIMYCVRGERAIQTLRRNYALIHSQAKRKVPIVLVVTCLESYQPDMEAWWRVNERSISNFGMTFAGHACITTDIMTGSKVMERRNQSYDTVCKLIEQCRLSNKTQVHTGSLQDTNHKLTSNMTAMNKRTNIVLFGQAGAGKNSLVNIMAGAEIARTSAGVNRCKTRRQKYSIEFGGESYKVFDIVGLDQPEMGIAEYPDAVENTHELIQYLEGQGGVDLLLFFMRAGRPTPMLQYNYRLLHQFLCDKKVPVIVVTTYLENEVGETDVWWKRNEEGFRGQQIHVAGHACITTIEGNSSHWHEESRTTIRNLVKEFAADGQKEKQAWGNNLFVLLMRRLRRLPMGRRNLHVRENIVFIKLCGMSRQVATQLRGGYSYSITYARLTVGNLSKLALLACTHNSQPSGHP